MKKTLTFAIVMLALAFFVSASVQETAAQGDKAKAGGAGELYTKHCAKCHGADGKGIKSLQPPDLTDAKWQASHTDKQITAALNTGKGVMPGYKSTLTPAQIAGLVKHVRGFGPKKK
ncbi:MAG: c-type cytochrome [Blastocatellia bacterium]|nr:c-type cytochrome [Blastocatellia bacterium]